jgi:ABC-type lipoprotein release transport system permease subunit
VVSAWQTTLIEGVKEAAAAFGASAIPAWRASNTDALMPLREE